MNASEVRDLLVSLGETEAQVVDTLLAQGCKGVIPGGSVDLRAGLSLLQDCPVAVYLKKHGLGFVLVDADIVLWGVAEWDVTNSLGLSSALEDFIVHYDEGKYPELMVEPEFVSA